LRLPLVRADSNPLPHRRQSKRRSRPEALAPRTHAVLYECGVDLADDSPELRLELTCDDEPIVYCEACWQREFGSD
jgi:hypothetical protein